jgi:hypothetical protein
MFRLNSRRGGRIFFPDRDLQDYPFGLLQTDSLGCPLLSIRSVMFFSRRGILVKRQRALGDRVLKPEISGPHEVLMSTAYRWPSHPPALKQKRTL